MYRNPVFGARVIPALSGMEYAKAQKLLIELNRIDTPVIVKVNSLWHEVPFSENAHRLIRMILGATRLLLFLDIKLKEVPSETMRIVADLVRYSRKPLFVTVSANDDQGSLQSAVETALHSHVHILGVGMPTSSPATLRSIAQCSSKTAKAGAHGIICDGNSHVKFLAQHKNPAMQRLSRFVVGIRDTTLNNDDQMRTSTLEDAVRNGGDHFIMGRPIVTARDPIRAFHRYNTLVTKYLKRYTPR